jgi:hypothetical protein
LEGLGEIIDDFFNSIGQKQTQRLAYAMSALPRESDIRWRSLLGSREGNGVSKVKEHGTIVTRVQTAKFLIIAV